MTTAADKVTAEHTVSGKPIAEKRRALGRGLESLLPGGPRVVGGTAVAPANAPAGGVLPSETGTG